VAQGSLLLGPDGCREHCARVPKPYPSFWLVETKHLAMIMASAAQFLAEQIRVRSVVQSLLVCVANAFPDNIASGQP